MMSRLTATGARPAPNSGRNRHCATPNRRTNPTSAKTSKSTPPCPRRKEKKRPNCSTCSTPATGTTRPAAANVRVGAHPAAAEDSPLCAAKEPKVRSARANPSPSPRPGSTPTKCSTVRATRPAAKVPIRNRPLRSSIASAAGSSWAD